MIIENKKISLISMLIIMFALACYMQSTLLINYDVSWLLLATRRWLAGGTYTMDFFDSDPPMILYIYALPVLLARFLQLNILAVFPLYIFSLSIAALYLSYKFLQKIFAADMGLRYACLLALAFGFWILPIYEFGQRDHLILMLITPYILSALAYMQGPQHSSRGIAIASGLMAGIGFGIKPFFLAVFLLSELYIALDGKRIRTFFRLENFLIAAITCVYVDTIFWLFPDYIRVIVPFAWKLYPGAMGVPLPKMFLSAPVVFCLLGIVFTLVMPVPVKYKNFRRYLVVITLAFLFIYFYQGSFYYYHFIPVFAYLCWLLIFIFFLLLKNGYSKNDFIYRLVLAGLFFIFLKYYENAIWTVMVFFPGLFFGFFALVFAALLFLSDRKARVKSVLIVVLPVFFVMVLAQLLLTMGYFSHRFAVSVLVMIALFTMLNPAQNFKIKSINALNTLLAILIFSYPAAHILTNYLHYRDTGKAVEKSMLTQLLKYKKAGPIAVFSSQINISFPAFLYAEADYGSRFPFFWMLPTLVKSKVDTVNLQLARNYFINALAQDLETRKPAYVFIDSRPLKPYLEGPFEYLTYFNNNHNFQKAWMHYRYLTTFNQSSLLFPQQDLLAFDVYQRT